MPLNLINFGKLDYHSVIFLHSCCFCRMQNRVRKPVFTLLPLYFFEYSELSLF
jgi:hypothetical protein